MPNQLLVMDVDGTQPLGSSAFIQVIKEIIRLKDIKGDPEVGVTVATGYVYPTLKEKLRGCYAPSTLMVLENGGCITDIAGNVIEYHPLTADELNNIKSLFQSQHYDIRFAGFCPRGSLITYYFPMTSTVAKGLAINRSIPRNRLILNIDDFLAMCLTMGACQIFVNVLHGTRFPPSGLWGLNHHFSQRIDMYGFLHSGRDKGEAVKDLMRLLSVRPEAVTLAGDDHNDISMFQKVPLAFKIAVGTNCPWELSSISDRLLNAPDDLTDELRNLYLTQP